MKKKIEILVIVIFILFLLMLSVDYNASWFSNNTQIDEYNWNNGFCENDGERLIYYGTSDREIYVCPLCGKYYKFNKVMSYKND